MHKIVIIGPAGSGKSILAQQIAAKTGAEYLEFDAVNHQANWKPIDKDEFRKIVKAVTAKDSWVLDGNYLAALGQDFWQRADAIVWLDRPFALVLARLVKRTLSRTIRRDELWNGNRESFFGNFFTKDSIILFMVKKWKSQQQKYNTIFNDAEVLPGVRKVRLKSDDEVKSFLSSL